MWSRGRPAQDSLVERRGEPACVVGQADPEVDPRDLGDDLADPLLLGERLARSRRRATGVATVAGLDGAVRDQRADHQLAVGQLPCRVPGQRHERCDGVDPAPHEVEHQPTRGGEEERLPRLLAQPLQRTNLSIELRHVKGLRGDGEQPQVRLEARLDVTEVGSDVGELTCWLCRSVGWAAST